VYDDGILIFGMHETEDFGIVGVYDAQDLQKKVNEQCKQMVPIIRPVLTVTMFEDKSIVSAEIPSIDISERPCYYGGIGRIKGSFIRVGILMNR
jgi:ATP-dependent DNA helicase RecG